MRKAFAPPSDCVKGVRLYPCIFARRWRTFSSRSGKGRMRSAAWISMAPGSRICAGPTTIGCSPCWPKRRTVWLEKRSKALRCWICALPCVGWARVLELHPIEASEHLHPKEEVERRACLGSGPTSRRRAAVTTMSIELSSRQHGQRVIRDHACGGLRTGHVIYKRHMKVGVDGAEGLRKSERHMMQGLSLCRTRTIEDRPPSAHKSSCCRHGARARSSPSRS